MTTKIIFSVVGFFLFPIFTETYASTIGIKINGENRMYDQEPVIVDNRVFVPIREISEDTGANVKYSNSEKKVTIEKQGTNIQFVIGTNKALVNGVEKDLPESFILNKRTMLPLRFINEMLGYRVDWLSSEKTVSVTTDRSIIVNNVTSNSEKYLGIPYLYGGTYEKDKKFDCSSFVQKVFKESGIELPRTSSQQSKVGSFANAKEPKPGDLLFFSGNKDGNITHVAIYIDEKTLLHATNSLGVSYTSYSNYWKDRLVMARDIIEIN